MRLNCTHHGAPAAGFVALVFSFLTAAIGHGQEPDASRLRQERLDEMRAKAAALIVKHGAAGSEKTCQVSDKPLLRFNDATREFHDGTLWAWTVHGRPLVLVSLERYEKIWGYELVSLSSSAFTVTDDTGWIWKPTESPFTEREIRGAPAPAETPTARQRQARDLSRRFGAVEFAVGDGQRIELRLLPRPIHQYEDAENGLLGGAMFVFCNGTNPEVLLIVEAVRSAGGASHWRYAFARVSTAIVAATLDGKEVWRAEEHTQKPRQQAPYTYFGVPLKESAPKRK